MGLGGVYVIARCCDLPSIYATCHDQSSETLTGSAGLLSSELRHGGAIPSNASSELATKLMGMPEPNLCLKAGADFAYATHCKSLHTNVTLECYILWRRFDRH